MIKLLFPILLITVLVTSCNRTSSSLEKKEEESASTPPPPPGPTWSVSSQSANGVYAPGSTLNFSLNYAENVTVTGTPRLGITLESGLIFADYVSGTGSSTLNFSYTVLANDLDTNGIQLGSTIALNGGTILDTSLANASLNINGASTSLIFVDGVEPTVSINALAAINNSNKAAYVINGACSEEGQTVNVDAGGLTFTPTCSSGTWSTGTVDLSSLSDGPAIAFTADLADIAGNNAPQATGAALKDTVLPAVTLNAPSNITPANASSYSLSGTCTENGELVFVNVGGQSHSPTCTAGNWNLASLDVTGIPDNPSFVISANMSDVAGNGATPAASNVVKDVTPVGVTLDAPALINLANVGSYTLTGTCTEEGRVVSVDVGGVTSSPTCTSLAWSTTINAGAASDSASLLITVDHDDALANNAPQATANVLKDTIAPTLTIDAPTNILGVNVTGYSLSGTCSENGLTINVDIGGLAFTPTCTSGIWTTGSVNLSAVTDGPSVGITADATDAAGNPATQATSTTSKDANPPTVTIDSAPTVNAANVTSYTLSGTCSDNGLTVDVNFGSLTYNPTCNSNIWSTGAVNVSAESDSPSVSVTADMTDSGGNPATQATASVLKDVVVPALAITSSPDITVGNVASYTLSGTCDEDGLTINVDIGGQAFTPTCSGGSWSTGAQDLSVVSDGAVAITADTSDAAGNAATQATANVVKSASLPTVTIDAASSANASNYTAYNLTGTCSEEGRAVSLNIGGFIDSPTCTTSVWSSTVDLTSVSDTASMSITADHDDAATNNAIQATTTVIKDILVPTLTIDATPDILVANVTSYTLTGTCDEDGLTINIDIGGQAFTPTCSGGSWSTGAQDLSVVSDGAVAITADTSDAAGNAATQATAAVTKDASLPTVTIDAVGNILASNYTSFTFSGTCSEEGRTVALDIGGFTDSPTCSASVWSTTLDLTSVGDTGTLNITADHDDAAANSAIQATTSTVKDVVVPTITIDAPADILVANVTAYTLTGTCDEDGLTINVDIGGQAFTPTCSGGVWSTGAQNLSVLSDGAVAITADTTDAAGNIAIQATEAVTKDASLPTVTIDAAAIANASNFTSYNLTGTCSEEGRTVSLNIGGVLDSPICTSLAWSSTVDLTSVSDTASMSITADHDDAASNNAIQATTSVIKDVVAPVIAITSSPDILAFNATAYTLSGTCDEDGLTITVDIGGLGYTPACSTGSWSTGAVDVSSLADDPAIAISIDTADAAGNAAIQDSTSVLKDAALPTVTIDPAATINNANKASYTLTGTCSENGEVVTVNIGGVSDSPTCTTLTWSSTVDVTSELDSASLSITADHDDASTNSAIQATTSVLKDTVDPTVGISAAADISNANKTAYSVNGTCDEEGQTVTVLVDGVVSATPICTTGLWDTGAFDVTAAGDGPAVSITANLPDPAGNNAPEASTTVLKDTVNPAVAIDPASTINLANETTYTVSGSCSENGQQVSVSVGGVGFTPTCTALAWTTGAVDVSGATDNVALSITADHTDAIGNNAAQASTSVIKDTLIPTITIDAPAAINSLNDTAYSLTGTCSENGQTLTVNIGGETFSPTCTTNLWDTGAANVSVVIDNASVAISVDMNDAAGNSANQATSNTLKDTGIPTVAITSSPDISPANATAYTVSGTCSENGQLVTVDIGGAVFTPNCATNVWNTGAVDVSGVADNAALPITADMNDAAGNPAVQGTATVIKNTVVAPISTISLTITGATTIDTGGQTTTIQAIAYDASSNPLPGYSLSVTVPGPSGATTDGPFNTDASGQATFTITSAAKDGVFSFSVTDGTVTSNGVNITFNLAGTATLEFDVDSYDYGLQAAPADQVFTVTNTGAVISDVLSFTVSGNKFSITTEDCTAGAGTLAAGASCNVTVRFTPGGGQANQSGTLTLSMGTGGSKVTKDTISLAGQQ